jgi:hypothetical protein
MGINLGSNFTMNAALPLDDRGTAADLTARNAIATGRRYTGMVVYVESEETNFQLIGGITNSDWAEFSGSGGGAGSTGGTETLTNNAVNTITNIGEYLVNFS